MDVAGETDPPMLRVNRDIVAAVIHHSAALTVYAAAEPEPSFTWYNGSTPLTSTTGVHTSSENRPVDITTASHGGSEPDSTDEDWKTVFRYSSTLTLSSVDEWDLTEYRVVVDNDYGSNQTSLRLIQASKYISSAITDFVLPRAGPGSCRIGRPAQSVSWPGDGKPA